MSILIWAIAVLIDLGVRLWYDGLRKPLTAAEVDEYTRLFEERAGADDEVDLAVMRKFLEEDDGKEFIMMNLLQYNPSPMKHPDTGLDAQAESILQEYFRPLMGQVIRRAGHPVLAGRAVGGYLDAWHTPPDPGWHGAGLIRDRSRSDTIALSLACATFHDPPQSNFAAVNPTT